jgi:hypothetical protein
VAELTETGAGAFWVSGSEQRSKVFEAFGKAHVKVVVCNRTPEFGVPPDWVRLGQSEFFVQPIQPSSLTHVNIAQTK